MAVSSMDFKKMKEIDSNTKKSVFGCIRQENGLLGDNIIPALINYICLSYVYVANEEYSTEYGDSIRYDKQSHTVTNYWAEHGGTAYGHFALTTCPLYHQISQSMTVDQYIWKVKIISNQTGQISIGIDSSDKECVNADCANSPNAFLAFGQSQHLICCYDHK